MDAGQHATLLPKLRSSPRSMLQRQWIALDVSRLPRPADRDRRNLAALCRLARRRRVLHRRGVLLGVRALRPRRLSGGASAAARLAGVADRQRRLGLLSPERHAGRLHQRRDRAARPALGRAGRRRLHGQRRDAARLHHGALAALRGLSHPRDRRGGDAHRRDHHHRRPVVRPPARPGDQPGAQRRELRRHPGDARAGASPSKPSDSRPPWSAPPRSWR